MLEILRANSRWPWLLAPLPENNLATRLEVVRHTLRTLYAGKPLLQVSPRYKMLRAALAGRYRFREMRTGSSVVVSPAPIKDKFATVVDALQYGLLRGGVGGIVRGRVNRALRQGRSPGSVYIADGTSSRDAGKWITPE